MSSFDELPILRTGDGKGIQSAFQGPGMLARLKRECRGFIWIAHLLYPKNGIHFPPPEAWRLFGTWLFGIRVIWNLGFLDLGCLEFGIVTVSLYLSKNYFIRLFEIWIVLDVELLLSSCIYQKYPSICTMVWLRIPYVLIVNADIG